MGISLVSCKSQTLRTSEGIPRKAIVSSKGEAPLYSDRNLKKEEGEAQLWEAMFIEEINETKGYYRVSRSLDKKSADSFYMRSEDVLEWNSNFSLAFKNSPHIAKRPKVKIYQTIDGLESKDENEIVMQEKEEHDEGFSFTDAQPILKEVDSDKKIYKIASLYDQIDEDGNYIFLGDYDSGYVIFDENAHTLYRYVSKAQLRQDALNVIAAEVETIDRTSNLSL